MITRKEAFAEIMKLIGMKFDAIVPAPIPNVAPVTAVDAPAMPVDYPLADGRVLTIDKCEVGGMVLINGEPAPDEIYVLADGTTITTASGIITEKVIVPETPDPLSTPAEMQAAIQKLADTSTSPDLQKMSLILKAVFENVFGYQIREQSEKANREAAITAYQLGFASQANEIDALKKENANLKLIAAKTLEMMEQVGESLVAAPLEEVEEKLTSYQKHQLKSAK